MGSAQRRWPNGFLQQGSLLLKDHPENILRLFKFSSKEETSKVFSSYKTHSIPLERVFNTLPPLDTLKDWIIKGFEEEFSIRFQKEGLHPHEKTRVQQFIKERYGNKGWTYREMVKGK